MRIRMSILLRFFIDVILMFKFFPRVCIVQIWDLNFSRNDLKQYKRIGFLFLFYFYFLFLNKGSWKIGPRIIHIKHLNLINTIS